MKHDNHEPQPKTPGVPHRHEQHPRPQGTGNVSPRPEAASAPGTTAHDQPASPPSISPDELRDNPVLLAQFTAYLQENHLHVPLLTPDITQMAHMRKSTPELYNAYLKALNTQIEADHTARTLPYTEPSSIAKRGQLFGFLAVVLVLVFCGYLAYLGHVISATIIAAFDLVALAGVFASTNNTDRAAPPHDE